MLPFLKIRRAEGGVITSIRKPDEGSVSEKNDKDSHGIEVAMEDFCHAEEKKDYKAMAKAFKAAFELLELEPHEEISHDNDESEDSDY